jgi:hypothetical protein
LQNKKKETDGICFFFFVSGWEDLNLRLLDPEPSALPLRYSPIKVTGATGIEPAVSGLTGRRDNQLRHAPIKVKYKT